MMVMAAGFRSALYLGLRRLTVAESCSQVRSHLCTGATGAIISLETHPGKPPGATGAIISLETHPGKPPGATGAIISLEDHPGKPPGATGAIISLENHPGKPPGATGAIIPLEDHPGKPPGATGAIISLENHPGKPPGATGAIISLETHPGKPPAKKKKWRRFKKPPAFDEDLTWEERLADAVTPLWRLSYDEQLQLKQREQERILLQLSDYLADPSSQQVSTTRPHPHPPPPRRDTLSFPLLPILPSPLRDGYRNKSTFSVNVGADGNPKTVGFYVGTGKAGNIVCVNGDHLLNMPERHKLVARCYQDFLRLSPLAPCLLFNGGGHWREVTVRTNAEGRAMAVVYFHPQGLTPGEVGVHKAALVDYFTQGPGSVCQLDSLYFQESSMTRCSHEESPYQLLHGQTHLHEKLLGFNFRISADAFFQVNQGAAEVLYRTVREMGLPEEGGRTDRGGGGGGGEGGGGGGGGGTLLDVCCGTGAMGIVMSPRAERVVGVELVQQAVEDARHNARLNGLLNCEFHPGKAEVVLPGLLAQLGPPSPSSAGLTAVVNPSRSGLHYRVVRALRNHPSIRRLVYVSCKPEGEAMRNFMELCCVPDPGGRRGLTGDAFSPTVAVPVDMFPHTAHCELVLVFER